MAWAFIGLAVAWFAALMFWGRADENLNKPVGGRVPDKLDKPFRSKVLRDHGQKAMPIFGCCGWVLWWRCWWSPFQRVGLRKSQTRRDKYGDCVGDGEKSRASIGNSLHTKTNGRSRNKFRCAYRTFQETPRIRQRLIVFKLQELTE